MKKNISGTKEWSVESVNCVVGCSHDCRYCYAREMAERYKRVSPGNWPTMRVRAKEVLKERKKADGTVMFPTTHDITPQNLDRCLAAIRKNLELGYRLLIVSKPRLGCIAAIAREVIPYRANVEFRFTIGSKSEATLAFWEPNAPSYEERFMCLANTYTLGFATSVSCEPNLCGEDVVSLVEDLKPVVSHTLWIGAMNHIDSRVQVPDNADGDRMLADVKAGQTPAAMRRIYEALKAEPKVRWKDSYREVLGLPPEDDDG